MTFGLFLFSLYCLSGIGSLIYGLTASYLAWRGK